MCGGEVQAFPTSGDAEPIPEVKYLFLVSRSGPSANLLHKETLSFLYPVTSGKCHCPPFQAMLPASRSPTEDRQEVLVADLVGLMTAPPLRGATCAVASNRHVQGDGESPVRELARHALGPDAVGTVAQSQGSSLLALHAW